MFKVIPINPFFVIKMSVLLFIKYFLIFVKFNEHKPIIRKYQDSFSLLRLKLWERALKTQKGIWVTDRYSIIFCQGWSVFLQYPNNADFWSAL